MKLATTLYTGFPFPLNDGYQFVYRKRIFESEGKYIEIIDSITTKLETSDEPEHYKYEGGDCEANYNLNTEIITEDIWQEYCDKLARYLKENNIINLKTQKHES